MVTDYSFIRFLYDEEIYRISPPRKTETVTFRGAVIFVEYPGIATLPTKEKMLLNKILEAVSLKPVQVSIVNLSEFSNRISARANIRFENAKVIFFTGKIPLLIKSADIKNRYEVIEEANSEFLLADPLEIIDQDKNLKKMLWDVLQQLFPLT